MSKSHQMTFFIQSTVIVVLVCGYVAIATMNDRIQILCLQDFYESTNGSYWRNNDGWNYIMSLNASTTNVTIKEICLNDSEIYGIDCFGFVNGSYTMTDYITFFSFYSNNLSGTIPPTICNFIQVIANYSQCPLYIDFSVNNLYGSLPACILTQAVDYPYAFYFSAQQNQLSGSIECNDSNVIIPDVNGKMNPFSSNIYTEIYLNNNYFDGTIPKCLTGHPMFVLTLSKNELTGELPCCFQVKYTLNVSNNNLKGGLPNNLITCSNKSDNNELLDDLMIDLSSNQLDGTISHQFWLDLANCSVKDEFITDKNVYGMEYYFYFNDNKFEWFDIGSIASSNNKSNSDYDNFIDLPQFFNNSMQNLLLLHNNNFENDNIGQLLNGIFSKLRPSILSLHNNSELTGDISKWNRAMHGNVQYGQNDENYKIFTLHNCDVYGSLSVAKDNNQNNRQLLPHMHYVTLYNNRLSCSIDDNVGEFDGTVDANNHHGYSAILLGNLFTLNDINQTKIFEYSLFKSVTFEYLTDLDNILGAIYIIISLMSLVLLVVPFLCKCKWKWRTKKLVMHNNNDHDSMMIEDDTAQRPSIPSIQSTQPSSFLNVENYNYKNELQLSKFKQNIMFVLNAISHWVIIMIVIILTIVYYIFSNYYKCGKMISHFSLNYYLIDNKDEKVWINLILVACFIAHFGIILYTFAFKLNKTAMKGKISKTERLIGDNTNVNDIPVIENDILADITSGAMITDMIVDFIVVLLCFAVYLLAIFAAAVYITTEVLPNDNIFDINVNENKYVTVLHYGLPLLLTFVNVYIIPKFVAALIRCGYSLNRICCTNGNTDVNPSNNSGYRVIYSYLILLLRSLLIMIFPLIVSAIILPQCGNYWTLFWNPCVNDPQSLEIDLIAGSSATVFNDGVLSTSKEICHLRKMSFLFNNSKQANICLRSFFDFWGLIVVAKLCLFVINPFVIYFIKRIEKHFNCVFLTSTKKGISIDSQFISITTKLEFFIVFSMISPYIVPIMALALYTNLYIYSRMIEIDRFKMKNFAGDTFPIWGLFGSCIVGQLLLMLFCRHLFDDITNWIFAISMIVLDSCFVLNLCLWKPQPAHNS